jgi:hypothetical protein
MKNKQLESFKKSGHLINKKIQCTLCSSDVTMFGSNLDNRIVKFGSIESLLETFKCRSCVSAAKPKKLVVKLTKRIKKEKTIETFEVPKMKFTAPRNAFLKDAPDLQDSMSASGSCLRPDIFLNSDRKCDSCPYVENCNATCKNLKYALA